jgi:hypothetical protein
MHLAFMFVAVTSIALPASNAGAAPKTIAEFCRVHPDFDFPDLLSYEWKHEGGVPKEVAAVGATNWRCMASKVYVCMGGASGSACWKMNPSLRPSTEIRESCEDNPGQDFVAIAVIGNSSSTWRCKGPDPTIIKTVPLDPRGFMKGTWSPLFDAHGTIISNIEFGADPR